ncbi:Gfo/Idh/MocA family oxidoreductase [Cryptosporangium phraense]|uniref:Dehydrogenase n=1 Tax=Cryptosporangium phraense TaxID=2593070 RepID=A0A545ANS4_9ACTN|nr:Gfo/Idh/MocA family oxidoreductase [Cryptosporangium phraense]TQS42933.1 dehydrogenase [Cryptosporangium phraense]
MRLGLIGLGRIGQRHAGILAGLPGVDSLVVTDAVPAVVKQVAEQLGAEAVDTPQALLEAGVDGVVIAASTESHPALLTAAVEAGVPVFCEKPLATTAFDAAALVQRLDGADVPVQIGFQRRFDPGVAAVHAAVRSGELGWLHTVRSTTLDPAPPPRAYIAASGGMFRDCGVHDFDVVRWVTGREVVEVYATGSNKGEPWFAEVGDVDTSAVVLTFDDGTLGLVSNTRYNARGYDVRLEAHGSADSVAAGLDDRLPLRSVDPGVRFPAGVPYPFFMDRFASAYRAEFEAFLEVAAGSRPSPCTMADALAADWIAEACGLSLREHRPVRVDEVRG